MKAALMAAKAALMAAGAALRAAEATLMAAGAALMAVKAALRAALMGAGFMLRQCTFGVPGPRLGLRRFRVSLTAS
ncbi:MAG: hypothetical protein LBC51_01070 [Treponema sp.]|nr:hypothetical protein [Treponema sp.]